MGIENIVAVDGNEQRLAFAKRMGAGETVNFMNYKGIDNLANAVKDASADILQILHSSVQVLLLLTAISISSSETAADFVNLVSLSTAVTLQSILTLTFAQRKLRL